MTQQSAIREQIAITEPQPPAGAVEVARWEDWSSTNPDTLYRFAPTALRGVETVWSARGALVRAFALQLADGSLEAPTIVIVESNERETNMVFLTLDQARAAQHALGPAIELLEQWESQYPIVCSESK